MVEIEDTEKIIINGEEIEVDRFERTIFLAVNLLTYSENVRESKIGNVIHKLRRLKEIPNIKKLPVFESLLSDLESKEEGKEGDVYLIYAKGSSNDKIQKSTLYLGMDVRTEENDEGLVKVVPFMEITKNYPRKNSLRYKLINSMSPIMMEKDTLKNYPKFIL